MKLGKVDVAALSLLAVVMLLSVGLAILGDWETALALGTIIVISILVSARARRRREKAGITMDVASFRSPGSVIAFAVALCVSLVVIGLLVTGPDLSSPAFWTVSTLAVVISVLFAVGGLARLRRIRRSEGDISSGRN